MRSRPFEPTTRTHQDDEALAQAQPADMTRLRTERYQRPAKMSP